MKRLFSSLRFRLVWWLSIILLATMLCVVSIIGMLWKRTLRNAFNDHFESMASKTAYAIDRVFVKGEQLAEIMSVGMENAPPENESGVARLVTEMMSGMHLRCPELSGMTVAYGENMLIPGEKYHAFVCYESNGDYINLHLNSIESDYFSKDWFTVPFALGKPVWTVPYLPETDMSALTFSYSVPFHRANDGGRVIAGVVSVDFRVDAFKKYLVEQLHEIRRLVPEGRIFLLNQFGQFVLAPERESDRYKTIYSLCDESPDSSGRDRRQTGKMFAGPSGVAYFRRTPLLSGPSEVFFAGCTNRWVVGIAVPEGWDHGLLLSLFAKLMLGWLSAVAVSSVVIFMTFRPARRQIAGLVVAVDAAGKGNYSPPLPEHPATELRKLCAAVGEMRDAMDLSVSRLSREITLREHATAEQAMARKIQSEAMPRRLPPFDGFYGVSAAGVLLPALEFGGDFYDVFQTGSGMVAVAAGRVSGRGISAALTLALIQSVQRSAAKEAQTPVDVIRHLEDTLTVGNVSGREVFYWLGFLNLHSGELTYANCGHPPPILRRASDGSTVILRQYHRSPLKTGQGKNYGCSTIALTPGDMLLLYTAGVVDASAMDGRRFGLDTVLRIVKRERASAPRELVSDIARAVRKYVPETAQSDDFSLLALRYDGCGVEENDKER